MRVIVISLAALALAACSDADRKYLFSYETPAERAGQQVASAPPAPQPVMTAAATPAPAYIPPPAYVPPPTQTAVAPAPAPIRLTPPPVRTAAPLVSPPPVVTYANVSVPPPPAVAPTAPPTRVAPPPIALTPPPPRVIAKAPPAPEPQYIPLPPRPAPVETTTTTTVTTTRMASLPPPEQSTVPPPAPIYSPPPPTPILQASATPTQTIMPVAAVSAAPVLARSALTEARCQAVAKQRASDAGMNGYGDDLQKAIYAGTYKDCLQWAPN